MEDIRAIRIAVISILLLLLCTQGAYAWNNIGVHPGINEYAYNGFIGQYMRSDPYLKQSSLDGGLTTGEAWDPQDSTSSFDRKTAIRKKSIKNWLVEGGFSADEPEVPMSLVHFYDPLRDPHYLTDWVNNLPDNIPWTGYNNPHIDAYQWAFERSDNPYGFSNGKQYYADAMASTDPNTVDYGKAWRSVGETMHLISDMTVPAHVRNDAHIPYLNFYDPLEYFTDSTDVDLYGTGYSATTDFGIYHTAYSSGQDIRDLFKKEATWTNQNFFSRDTVPQYNSGTTPNGKPAYPAPNVNIDPSFTGYYTTTLDGNTSFPLARQAFTGILWKTPYLVVDQNVCNAQRSVLIPTSIKSSEAVLDAFLPRFQVVIDNVVPDTENAGDYVVTAHITHVPTREWPNDLTIRNGAHVVIDSVDNSVTTDTNLDNNDNLNRIRFKAPAIEGSSITVYYDLGGYKISSKPFTVEAQPEPTAAPTTAQYGPTPSAVPTPAPDLHVEKYYFGNGNIQTERGYDATGVMVYEKLYKDDGTLYSYWILNSDQTATWIVGGPASPQGA